MSGPIRAYLVAGGRYHDIDYARAQLLSLLAEDPDIRTDVASDYADTDAIAAADFLLTYTCDVPGTPEQQKALAEYVANGGRWLALHGTNSVLEFMAEGVRAPRGHDALMQTLGSQFLAHPPIGRFTVRVAEPEHPLVAGIDDFEVEDELYLCEYHGEIRTLLDTRFSGRAPGFVEGEFPGDEPRPVLYLHPVGAGEVLYLTLGHCRSKYDMRPVMDEYPRTERCAWESPIYWELLRRGIAWAAGRS